MLYITTSQKDASVLDQVLKQVLPYVDTPHKVLPFEGELPKMKAGDVCLGMGASIVDLLKAEKLVKRNLTMGPLRGEPVPYGEGKVMVTYDPYMAQIDPMLEPDVVWDVRLACRYHDTGKLEPEVGSYHYVSDFDVLLERIKVIHAETGKRVPVSPDLETIGLDPYHKGDDERPPARIVTITFTVDEGESFIYRVPATGKPLGYVMGQINWLLTSDVVNSVGANLKFDAHWIAVHWGLEITNQLADTMLIGSLLNENRSNSLTTHSKQMTPLGGYDTALNTTHDKSRMDIALAKDPEGFAVYAGGDTDACLRTYNVMKPQLLRDKRLSRFYTRLLQPAARVFGKLERRGIVVDQQRYAQVRAEVVVDIEKNTAKALAMVPRRLKLKYADTDTMKLLSKPKFLEDFLFTPAGLNLKPKLMTPSGKGPSTAAEHLEMFHDHPEAQAFVKIMKELNGSKKTLSTFVDGFLSHLRSDGRFHPTFNLHRGDKNGEDLDGGTNTGRLSSTAPAYQVIPKHTRWAKALRSVYVPPPGYAILKGDFSQGELRISACVANETTMIHTYASDIDLHLRSGAKAAGLTLEQALALKHGTEEQQARYKFIRQSGKPINFGFIYGMSAEGYVDFSRKSYGVVVSHEEAQQIRNSFFGEYPLLLKWHDRYKAIARNQGYVRNPLGRVRHLPLIYSKRSDIRSAAERQSVNSPIQSCLSDCMLLGMVELDRQYPDLWMFGMTHDDVGMYVPEDDVMLWARRLKETLENLPLAELGWEPQLQLVVDCEASHDNLASVKELKLA